MCDAGWVMYIWAAVPRGCTKIWFFGEVPVEVDVEV